MKYKVIVVLVTFLVLQSCSSKKTNQQNTSFNIEKDLLLLQLDCKTDVDDLHTAAAFATLVSNAKFSELNYHVVTGTYGIQDGLYVPPNPLLELAFKDKWTDAHNNQNKAIDRIKVLIKETLNKKGDVWIAEAGQSDFSAKLVKAIHKELKNVKTSHRIHIVQHSDWNEKQTSQTSLEFVKTNTHYQKIPDGNKIGNGTPGFQSFDLVNWKDNIINTNLTNIWQLAIDLANQYNGKEKRYDNKSISSGGLDFSDLSEVCWILDLKDIKNVQQFFKLYAL